MTNHHWTDPIVIALFLATISGWLPGWLLFQLCEWHDRRKARKMRMKQ